ncbi:hypothetical protein DFH06DRAFT_148025 [Mycena polygramma]|nr:hypothetical protein DFH06DRAFT_148025 [Mycena polygramma]
MVRPILATDWDRPLAYAPRVKILSMTYSSHENLSQILQALSSCCCGGIIFPNLQSFTLRSTSRSTSSVIPWRIFCPSTLKCIVLSCEGSDTTISPLSTLASSCPGLTDVSLIFRFAPDHIHIDGATSLFVCGLHRIESLHMGVPTVTALRHIGRLPRLTVLTMTAVPASLAASDHSPPAFPYLRQLTLGPLKIDRATEFFKLLAHSPLVSLQVTLTDSVPVAETNVLFESLRMGCSHKSLRSFTLLNHSSDFRVVGQGTAESTAAPWTFCLVTVTLLPCHWRRPLDSIWMMPPSLGWPWRCRT